MSTTIHVLGAVNLDQTLLVQRFPEPGETIHAAGVRSSVGGKGANQAIAAARAGAAVRMHGAVGDDEAGHQVVRALEVAQVETSGMRRADAATGRAEIVVDRSGENAIILLDGANGELGEADARAATAALASGDLVLLQNEIGASASTTAASLARAAGATVIWNAAPAPARAEELVEADIAVVNETELHATAALVGVDGDAARDGGARVPEAALMRAVAERLGAGWLVCTLGARGALAAAADGTVLRLSSPSVRAVDTTGAGDAFIGYFAAALAGGATMAAALSRAAVAGALAVTRPGAAAAIPGGDEVAALLASTEAERNHQDHQDEGGTP